MSTATAATPNWGVRRAAVIVAGVAFAAVNLVAVVVLLTSPHESFPDFRIVYNGVLALSQGQNPYRATGFFNPAWVAVLLLPLTNFSYPVVGEAWFWLNLFLLLAVAMLLTQEWPLVWRGLFLLAVPMYAPSLNTLIHGQTTILVLLGAILPLLTHSRLNWLAVLSLPLLSVKPHLGFFIGLALLWLWYSQRKAPLATISSGLVAVLFILPLALRPAWPIEWISEISTGDHQFYASPVIGHILSERFPALLAWALHGSVGLLAFLVTAHWVRSRRLAALPTVALACVLSLILTPYTHTYDYVLLIPAIAYLVSPAVKGQVSSVPDQLGSGMAAFATYILPFGQFTGLLSDASLVVLPLALLAYLLFRAASDGSSRLDRRP